MTMKKAVCVLFILLLIYSSFLSSCNDKEDTFGKTANGKDSSTEEEDSDYIKVKTLSNTIRQEIKENDINIILVNDIMALTVDELFSYTNKYTVDIYALSDSSIDYSKKEMSLNVGYNHFQIKFKNLFDCSETIFDIEVFRDPGVITREFSKYQLQKEITKSINQNGLPKFDLKIYVSNWFDIIDVNGEKLPTQIVECNLKVAYYADYYIDSEKFRPSTGFPHSKMEAFSITHTFTDLSETFETTIDFPQYLWTDFCSQYPYSTLENTSLGLNDRYDDTFYVYSGSYILLSVDYSKYQFD